MKYVTSHTTTTLLSALIRSVMTLMTLFYVPMSNFALQYFHCVHQLDGTWTLNAQPSIKCYAGQHMDISRITAAVCGIVLYIVGIPVCVTYVLYKNKHTAAVRDGDDGDEYDD